MNYFYNDSIFYISDSNWWPMNYFFFSTFYYNYANTSIVFYKNENIFIFFLCFPYHKGIKNRFPFVAAALKLWESPRWYRPYTRACYTCKIIKTFGFEIRNYNITLRIYRNPSCTTYYCPVSSDTRVKTVSDGSPFCNIVENKRRADII